MNLINTIRCHSKQGSRARVATGICLTKSQQGYTLYFETVGKGDGLERQNKACATAAVVTWQRMGGKGQWGIREGRVGGKGNSNVLEICEMGGEEWKRWKMIEVINKKGVIRVVGEIEEGEGVGERDEISKALGSYCGKSKVDTLSELRGVMGTVDDLVKNWSKSVKRVILHGNVMQDKYIHGRVAQQIHVVEGCDLGNCELPETGELVIRDAHYIDILGLLHILQVLARGEHYLCFLIDTLASPRPGQLGAPVLDYERLCCGWSIESVLERYGACPPHLRAISSGYALFADGVEFHSRDGLMGCPPPAGDTVLLAIEGWAVEKIFGPHAERLQLVHKWAPAMRVTTDLVGTFACIVFATTRLPRSTLYRLRASCDLVIVIMADDQLRGVYQGSHWDTTCARVYGPRRPPFDRNTTAPRACLPKPNKRKHSIE